ncbi:MAG: pdaA [Verrucomicrobiales bacterium]|nr:pdaA [Verrucomicrobiales bacterium]
MPVLPCFVSPPLYISANGRIPGRHFAATIIAAVLTGCSGLPPEAPLRPLPILPAEVSRGQSGHGCIALTFDAGGTDSGLAELLESLQAFRVTCTFFITGTWASGHPRHVREIAARGHEIGNHTWSHSDLTRLDGPEIQSEISRTDLLLTALTGRTPRPLLRAPYGARNSRVLNIASDLGYTSVYWTLDSLDSIDPPKSPPFLFNQVTSATDADLDGSIVLMHVGEPSTAAALPGILRNLQSRGFRIVKISHLPGLCSVWRPGNPQFTKRSE